MRTNPTDDGNRPWYRHRWPWLLAIAPLAAFFGGMFTLWLAVTTSDPLVVDDYYREGRAINQQLARDRLATSLGLRATLTFAPEGGTTDEPAARIAVRLAAERGSGWPAQLRLLVVHATRAQSDLEYALEHAGEGRYLAGGPMPAAGRWLVQIEDPGRTWRLVAPSVTHFDAPLELRATAP
jgi:hypothetical protein